MNFQKKNTALLPAGFEDLLPPDAHREYEAIATLMGVFRAFGYERVKPPLAEFEEGLLTSGPGAALSADTFRLMDPLSQRMMALRSDITAQIARIAQQRLGSAPRPLRLTYANDVLRMNASHYRSQRQFTQVGCETVGGNQTLCDIEVAVVALRSLTALNLPNLTIDFSMPVISGAIFDASNTDKKDIDILRSKLSGKADKVFAALEELSLPQTTLNQIIQLKDVVSGIEDALNDLNIQTVSVTIDPLETQGFEYHSGVSFTLFAENIRGEIGRGGRYDLSNNQEKAESASGFTLYMDTIRQALPELQAPKVKNVDANTSWSEIQNLQNQGFIVKKDI